MASADPDLLVGTTLPEPYTDAAGLAYIERQWSRARRGEGLSLAVQENGGPVVGATSLMFRRADVADLGYWLVRDARGRGLGGETVALIVPWALNELAIEAVEAFVHAENHPSRHILETHGFTLTGIERHSVGRIDEELLVYRRAR